MIPTLSIFIAGWALGWLFPWRWTAPAVRILLERARYDLDRGWPQAAHDALSRALVLLAPSRKEPAP